jgi:hypothetical protein
VLELTALWASRPALNAPAERVAAWYQAKGELHEQMAGAATAADEASAEQAHAAAAYEHARRLLLDARPRPTGAEAEAVGLGERADAARGAAVAA